MSTEPIYKWLARGRRAASATQLLEISTEAAEAHGPEVAAELLGNLHQRWIHVKASEATLASHIARRAQKRGESWDAAVRSLRLYMSRMKEIGAWAALSRRRRPLELFRLSDRAGSTAWVTCPLVAHSMWSKLHERHLRPPVHLEVVCVSATDVLAIKRGKDRQTRYVLVPDAARQVSSIPLL